MLVKITNHCAAGCSHCFEDSTVKGEHMTWETFERTLAFVKRVEARAWERGAPREFLLSGGECTDHPEFLRMLETVIREGFRPYVLTHGAWLADPERRAAILRPEWRSLYVQVTHDPRFYPKAAPPRLDDPRLNYFDRLNVLLPLGRLARKKGPHPVPTRKGPSSFNLRSMTRSLGSIDEALAMLRLRAAVGLSGHCIPNVSHEGDVLAGESRLCFKIGTVDSTNLELSKALCEMRCNACGLVDGLSDEHKRAIGES